MAGHVMEAQPCALEFDLQATARLIIDMQRDFVMPGGLGHALSTDLKLILRDGGIFGWVSDSERALGALHV